MHSGPRRIVIADDQRIIRDSLETILGAMDDVDVVGTAQDGAEAVELVERHSADLVLMDLRMPGMDGVEATRTLRQRRPDTAVVVLTTYVDDESVTAALAAGATGYLTKNATVADIRRALDAAGSGHSLVDTAAIARLVESASRQPSPQGRPARHAALPDGLTEREGEVLALVAQGRSNAEIGAQLYVAMSTVKTHINQIYTKTGCQNRTQAVLYARNHGIA
ncbi:DNA-binding response regulator [Actinocatenispora thailandica]|uniref:DNA-binding response regulator n=1 Tax=Actinocatenispora thailandica TaxID=227318 RepID=A0A7R7HZB6_9ACTN|nr:response regulator transcription factor [Actinocatenispora thailandica]BCJ37189.1 DNA-binding response regulator [Actinocatenispora thailandica]